MAILRKNKKSDYTIIDNNIFKNKTLSLKAKGMICTMLSLPDGWEFSEEGLTKLSNDGLFSIRSTLKELMEYGYLVRGQAKSENGKFANAVYTIYEEPLLEKPIFEKPIFEKPISENKHNKILYNKELNNKLNNNINIITKERFKKPTLEEVEEYCKQRNSSVDAKVFYEYFETGGWVDSKGNKVKNWKQKIITWENNRNKKETKVPEWFDKKIESEEIDDETRRLIEEIERT